MQTFGALLFLQLLYSDPPNYGYDPAADYEENPEYK